MLSNSLRYAFAIEERGMTSCFGIIESRDRIGLWMEDTIISICGFSVRASDLLIAMILTERNLGK